MVKGTKIALPSSRATPAPPKATSWMVSSALRIKEKLQAPGTKHQRNSKHQIPKHDPAAFWSLGFGASLELGASDLELQPAGPSLRPQTTATSRCRRLLKNRGR